MHLLGMGNSLFHGMKLACINYASIPGFPTLERKYDNCTIQVQGSLLGNEAA